MSGTGTATGQESVASPAKMSVLTLTAMVVGSMVGAGVFSLPARFGSVAGVFAAMIAWVVAGVGMLMLALVFQMLAIRKPALDAGVFAYAKAGFGDYVGFNSAFGYWASACAGNTFYWVFIMTTIGKAWPALGKGDTILAAALSAAGVWTFHVLISRGVKDAAVINRIVTVAKIVPILVFIVVVLFAFDAGVFADNFWGGKDATFSSVFSQVKDTMIVTVFVFLGIEGASVYSRYAKRREDVGRATVLGFLSVLAIFASVTLLSYGVLPRADIADLRQPSMAPLLAEATGGWGSTFISVGVVVSVLGAYLAWTLMASEVLFIPARNQDMPRFLGRENSAGAPITALLMTTMMITLMIVVTLLSDDALNFLLDLTTSLSLVPYLLAAFYAVKITAGSDAGGSAPTGGRPPRRDLAVAALASLYTVFLVFAAGTEYLLVSCVVYFPGTALYVIARRENAQRLFTTLELGLAVVLGAGAVTGVVGLTAGWISI